MPIMRRIITLSTLAAALGSIAWTQRSGTQLIETRPSEWEVLYDGYGSVSMDPLHGLLLEPRAPDAPDETHAALALARQTLSEPVRDFKVTLVFTVEAQLRAESPNAWEAFWLFFNSTRDAEGRVRANYFIFKPNGIELGRAFNHEEQVFLSTTDTPRLRVGVPATLTLTKRGPRVEVGIDGKPVMDYTGGTWPQALFDVDGALGVYTEDARVRVQSVQLERLAR